MLSDIEAALPGNALLSLLDLIVKELLHPAAIQAHKVIVVRSLVEFKYRLARFKMIPVQETGLLELRQHAVNRCQSDIHIFGEQDLVHVFCTQVADRTVLENFEDLEPGQGRFQTAGFQLGRISRHVVDRIRYICFII